MIDVCVSCAHAGRLDCVSFETLYGSPFWAFKCHSTRYLGRLKMFAALTGLCGEALRHAPANGR